MRVALDDAGPVGPGDFLCRPSEMSNAAIHRLRVDEERSREMKVRLTVCVIRIVPLSTDALCASSALACRFNVHSPEKDRSAVDHVPAPKKASSRASSL
jgi:hypothetical protein